MIDFFKGLLSQDRIIEAGVAAGDKLVYTDEERADDRSEKNALFVEYVRASQPQERARRFIAISVTLGWIVNGAVCMVAYFVDWGITVYLMAHPEITITPPKLFPDMAEFALWYVMPIMTTVTGFYFWKRIKEANK